MFTILLAIINRVFLASFEKLNNMMIYFRKKWDIFHVSVSMSIYRIITVPSRL